MICLLSRYTDRLCIGLLGFKHGHLKSYMKSVISLYILIYFQGNVIDDLSIFARNSKLPLCSGLFSMFKMVLALFKNVPPFGSAPFHQRIQLIVHVDLMPLKKLLMQVYTDVDCVCEIFSIPQMLILSLPPCLSCILIINRDSTRWSSTSHSLI